MARRRANGEGSIRKRKDGRWEGRYTAGFAPETNKQMFKYVHGKTKKECEENLKKEIALLRRFDFKRTKEYTVAEWMRLWFEMYSRPNIRESTIKAYTNIIERSIVPFIGEIKLKKLTSIEVQRLYNDLKNKCETRSAKKINNKHCTKRFV